jgi:hypothetical protein
MRLWSIHPQYLDSKGLVALWREGLLAKKVLEGKTKGYKNHPQLERFKNFKNPILAINSYLFYVLKEAKLRNYKFNEKKLKIDGKILYKKIPVTEGQIKFEFRHLLSKLKKRNKRHYRFLLKLKKGGKILTNPIFYQVKGKKEKWEK